MKVTILNKIMERSTFVKSFKPRGCLRCITYLKGKKMGYEIYVTNIASAP
jgi:hypothetical protein